MRKSWRYIAAIGLAVALVGCGPKTAESAKEEVDVVSTQQETESKEASYPYITTK